MSSIVIGIDAGPKEHSAVALDSETGLICGTVSGSTSQVVAWILEHYRTGSVAIEWIECYGMPVGAEVFQTVGQIGILIARLASVRLIPRRDIRLHLCASPRAKDANIRQSLLDRFGKPGTKRNPGGTYGISKHLWSALAVAVTAADVYSTKHEAFWHNEGIA